MANGNIFGFENSVDSILNPTGSNQPYFQSADNPPSFASASD